MGEVKCGKIERGVKHPQLSGFIKINASSMGPKEWKGLSPMLLGPFQIVEPLAFESYFSGGVHPKFTKIEGNQTAIVKKFENYWQGSKIYNVDVKDGTIQPSFFQRRAEMFNLDKGKRRALPKAKYGVPIAGYYNGKVMDYIESRKKVYALSYEYLVTRTPEYKNLVLLLASGNNLLIVGPDGRDIPIEEKSLKYAIDDPKYIFGHELVLCSLLSGLRPWL